MAEYTIKTIEVAKELLSEREFGLIKREEYINKRSKIVNWLYFSLAYLKLSKLGCEYLIKTKEVDHKYDYLFAPILYNFKHSLELMVKAFIVIAGEKYKPDHNLKFLFESFRKVVLKKVKMEDKNLFNKLLDRFYVLIYNYYYLKCLEKKFKTLDVSLIDEENTFLKYPENSVGIQIDYWSLVNVMNEGDIIAIDQDLERAENMLLKFNVLFKQAKFI